MIGTIPACAVSDHFVDANKMIQAGAGPFSRRQENGRFDDSNSIEFDGIRITPTFTVSRPSDHFVGVNKMVGSIAFKPLEIGEVWNCSPAPKGRPNPAQGIALGHSYLRIPPAPTGRAIPAQGNALGLRPTPVFEP